MAKSKKEDSNFLNDVFNENKYCPNCKQNVVPAKKPYWVGLIFAIILGFIFGGIAGAIIFFIVVLLLQNITLPKQCPRCGYKFSFFRQNAKGKALASFGTSTSFSKWIQDMKKAYKKK